MKRTGDKDKKTSFSKLRKQAEELLKENPTQLDVPASIEEAQRLITELQVHHIELELQNDELRKAQEQIAAERERYADLYNFAPAAYFTFDERDVIIDLNLMAADMLGNERKFLVNHPLTPYITAESLQTFVTHRNKALETKAPQTCELTIRPRNRAEQIHIQAHTVSLQRPFAPSETSQLWRTVMTDVTARKRAEEKLRYQAHLLENVKDAIITTDPALRITQWNQAAENLYGWKPEEVIGLDIDEVCRTQFTGQTQAEAQKRLRAEKIWRGELRQKRRDGTEIWVSTSVSLLEDENGNIQGGIAINSDITPHKQDENILQARLRITEFANKNTLSETLQNALDELCALSESPIGFFHFVEEDQQTLSLQAWSTRTLKEMCKAEGKGRHYNINEAGVWVDCVREGKPIIHNDYDGLPATHRKGLPEGHAPITREMVFPIIRSQNIVAIIGAGNKSTEYTDNDLNYALRLADLIWDITERKSAEENLHVKDRAMETSINGIAISDLSGRLTYVNPAFLAMWGYEKDSEVKGRPVVEFWEYKDAAVQVVQALHESGGWLGELIALRKDGAKLEMQVSASMIADEKGQPAFMLASFLDITERKRADEQIRKLSRVVEQSQISVVITNTAGEIEYVNPKFCEITGYAKEEVLGQNPRILKSVGKPAEEYRELWQTILSGHEWRGEFHNMKKNGEPFWESTIVSSIKNEREEITHFVAVKEDVTERKKNQDDLKQANSDLLAHLKEIKALHEQLREQAIRDPITGLFNRRYLQETLEREIARAEREQQEVGVIIMDIDRFKQVNDTYGHKAGDLVLENLGGLISGNLRMGDIPCRYGGEEFTIIMPGATLETTVERAQLLRDKINEMRTYYDMREIKITASMGVAAYPLHGSNGEEALIHADRALYHAKENGRDKVVVYHENMTMRKFLDTNHSTGVNYQ